jgi:organic hydroperoxide reductase OsmC/OhrA
MHPYPRTYIASAAAENTGSVAVTAAGLPGFETAAPPEFDGPGGLWSPQTLLCASIADCFILTFRSVARAARFEWLHLEYRVEGILDRADRVSQFTRYTSVVKLTVATWSLATAAATDLSACRIPRKGCLSTESRRPAATSSEQSALHAWCRRFRPPATQPGAAKELTD